MTGWQRGERKGGFVHLIASAACWGSRLITHTFRKHLYSAHLWRPQTKGQSKISTQLQMIWLDVRGKTLSHTVVESSPSLTHPTSHISKHPRKPQGSIPSRSIAAQLPTVRYLFWVLDDLLLLKVFRAFLGSTTPSRTVSRISTDTTTITFSLTLFISHNKHDFPPVGVLATFALLAPTISFTDTRSSNLTIPISCAAL